MFTSKFGAAPNPDGGYSQKTSGKLTAGSVALELLVFLPGPSAAIYFPGPPTAAPCVLLGFYSCAAWGRQAGMCLPHFIKTSTPACLPWISADTHTFPRGPGPTTAPLPLLPRKENGPPADGNRSRRSHVLCELGSPVLACSVV